MQDWQDDNAILDQITSLLSSAEAQNFARAAACAAGTLNPGHGDMGRLTAAVYAELGIPSRSAPEIANKDRVYSALEKAQGGRHVAEAVTHAKHPWLIRLMHVAVKFRYTRPGRWVARALPPSWQRRLKARLLASM